MDTITTLNKSTQLFLQHKNFKKLTEVQVKTIKAIIAYKDVIVKSFTGSGKTLAFLIPIAEILLSKKIKENSIYALILSPTRELATQIHSVLLELLSFNKEVNLSAHLLIGGGTNNEPSLPRSLNILIGTPGRIHKFFDQELGSYSLKEFEILIFDEADRLLDLGFEKDVEFILSKIPKFRRTGLFSATECTEIKKMGLRNPIHISIIEKSTMEEQNFPENLNNKYEKLSAGEKLPRLLSFCKKSQNKKIIVFFLTCFCVDYFFAVSKPFFENEELFSIHGKMSKKKRELTIKKFTNSNARAILFTTDLLARGIDFNNVDYIVQFDIPQDPDFFVHRIGRTARMGKTGEAILYIMPFEMRYLDVLKGLKVNITQHTKIDFEKGLGPTDLVEIMRNRALKDREILEKGTRAFVSYIRGYRENLCKTEQVLSEMPFGETATAFGLLYVPTIRDIKEYPKKKNTDSVPGFAEIQEKIDIKAIRFLNKHRQKMHEIKMERKKVKREEELRMKLENRKKAKKMTKLGVKRRRKIKQSENQKFQEEWNELDRETKLYKKFKKKKISKIEYEIAVGERRK